MISSDFPWADSSTCFKRWFYMLIELKHKMLLNWVIKNRIYFLILKKKQLINLGTKLSFCYQLFFQFIFHTFFQYLQLRWCCPSQEKLKSVNLLGSIWNKNFLLKLPNYMVFINWFGIFPLFLDIDRWPFALNPVNFYQSCQIILVLSSFLCSLQLLFENDIHQWTWSSARTGKLRLSLKFLHVLSIFDFLRVAYENIWIFRL